MYLRRVIFILDATSCVCLAVLSDWSPARDLDPAGINNDVDAEGLVVVLESLPPCLDVIGSDGVDDAFEGDIF